MSEFIKVKNTLYRKESINRIDIVERDNIIEVSINNDFFDFEWFGGDVEERQKLLNVINKLDDVTNKTRQLFDSIIKHQPPTPNQ